MPYFDWLLNNWRVVREHPRLAVALFMIGALSAWLLLSVTISNLQSQVDLLRVRLEVGSESSPPFPLPEYSLGGSEFGTLSSDEWVNPTTARRIELDWGGLGGVDVQAVLRMRALVPQRAQGSDSAWVETRIPECD